MVHPQKLMTPLNFRPKRGFSQNFLTSGQWAEKLAQAVLCSQGEVWEIGPGLGAVTEHLVKSNRPLRLFEIDCTLVEYLRKKFLEVEVIEGDFLKANLEPYLSKGPVSVLSNLPYHLSSQIFLLLHAHRSDIGRMVLTFQREFADRLLAAPSTKAYGSLSVLAQTGFRMSALGTLAPTCFYPVPEVASKAIVFAPIFDPTLNEPLLESLVRRAFSHRRKRALSNLCEEFERPVVEMSFKSLNLDSNVRADAISVSQFQALARLFAKT